MNGRSSVKILLVDDKATDRELATLVLRQGLNDARVDAADDAVSLVQHLTETAYSLVITEHDLHWSDGIGVFDMVQRLQKDCPVLVFTHLQDQAARLRATTLGVADFVVKESSGFLHLPAIARALIERREGGERGAAQSDSDRVLEHLPVGVFSLDARGTVTSANPYCASLLLGADNGSPVGSPFLSLVQEPSARSRIELCLHEGSALKDLETELHPAGGDSKTVRIKLWPAVSGGSAFEGTIENITPQKETLRAMSDQARELRRSNQDLERFAYVASHDLQEPLSYISRYAKLYEDKFGGKVDPDADRFMERIMESSKRLQSMVDDILAYSRVGTRAAEFEQVDVAQVADEAAASLESAELYGEWRYKRDPMPTLYADRRQLDQLFRNLFSNALKFRGKAMPEIRVTASEEPEGWHFVVSDNGIGIEPGSLERIFGMFQRLHTADEYPGTGIGLAICQSIVERHGGRIWAESTPGSGTSIHFTIASQRPSAPPRTQETA